MLLTKLAVILTAGAFLASAINLGEYGKKAYGAVKRSLPDSETIKPRQNTVACPAVWTAVASELSTLFLNTTDSLCIDDARAAIRAAFRDCGAWNITSPGGCDGSLILAADELTRPENNGLQAYGAKILAITQKYQAIDSSITAADMIQFASSVTIVTCPLGPRVKTYVGRNDSSIPAVKGHLPNANASAASLIALFAQKGINAAEIIAFIGAHSSSKQFFVNETLAGAPQDSTPGEWDVDFYAETISKPTGVFVFDSDASLAVDPRTSATFSGFVGKQKKWDGAFIAAMTKLSLLGVPEGSANLIDCTSMVPTTRPVPRDVKRATFQ
ncbi:Manganese peroxidase [Lachnellula suecica]|uniref:Peroxidase n=1 Tax=Lachnellula suecica TaxID=602035 RepID=A0A8T9CCE6_9HELO|nr:Manganese peroxidase [Lachnellula suecica]